MAGANGSLTTKPIENGFKNESFILFIGDSVDSKFAHLVANYCSKFGLQIDINSSSEKDLPKLHSKGSVFYGSNTVSKCLSASLKKICNQNLIGNSPESISEISQWLSWNNFNDAQHGVLQFSNFQHLNEHLQTRSVVVGSGTNLTLADFYVFNIIHSALEKLDNIEKKIIPNVLRWFDYIQNKGDVKSVYSKLPIGKMNFNSSNSQENKSNNNQIIKSESKKEEGEAEAKKEKKNGEKVEISQKDKTEKDKTEKDKTEKDKKEKDKKVKEKKEKPPAQKKEVDSEINVLNVKIGQIKKVWKHPSADTLYVEEIDLGEETPRQIVSGLAKFLTEEEMLGRKVVVLCNVKSGKVRDIVSSGLVLCASNEDHSKCEPISPPENSKIGEKVTFAGYEGSPEEVLNPKKKQFEKIQPNLKVDENGIAKYKDVPFMTSVGPCTSKILHALIK